MAEMETKVLEEENNYVFEETEEIKTYEYEKLLNLEANRQLNVKARKMVKLGLFEQTIEKEIDFGRLSKVTYKKPFKGVFDLYISNEGQLLYIHEKTESETGRAYEYDVIGVEKTTDEEYQQILSASAHEKEGLIKFAYCFSWVTFFVAAVIYVTMVVFYIIQGIGFSETLALHSSALTYLGMLAALVSIASITYRKFTTRK